MPELTRRGFLGACIGAGAAGAVASLPVATWTDVLLAAKERPLEDGAGILVLVTLYGGNDGINTVIPFADNAYRDARPELAYSADKVLELDDKYGLNPGMRGMADMFRDGSLAIVRGVGYPDPDRSHFRSIDIWQSASLDNSTRTGWIGRWLDSTGEDPIRALHVGPVVPPLAVGEKTVGALLSWEAKPSESATGLITALGQRCPDDTPAMRMVCDSYRSAAHVNKGLEPMFAEDGPLSDNRESDENGLAVQLDTVAACIAAELPTQVYSVGMGGFDTHADERGTQQNLLEKLDKAVTGFMKQISRGKHGKDVIVMAYSEFGRRVAANASDGTDHGSAGPVFIAGDRVRGGFYGDDPSLTDLVDDDLKVTTDFRDIYHEVLERGLDSDSEPVLGKKRKEIGFLKT
ncbi:DUF1501 domain-containing protein [Mycolicibacterium vanbaalenii]|jgi:uncharacterized protein (DUF1501 family)|uniref:DUF1501 domain-containing protein n=1 Tax=Mycolicibacterium vanbaalenii TaxID=110539 RepID=UPI001F22340D|nr:DUF1501 domain-containing protein [Mycolicibacterium vanbaalenii]UJL31472.1 DUF1501 domain-containing protein [Mycolicibacterium vanbaalenii]WND58320.1 DUF1501 domain-containing protein [Mycolicibacterium vanbaalenii]